MFELLEKINRRPKPFEFYTAIELWTDEHTSKQMLSYHLNEDVDLSSRKAEFIDRSVAWMVDKFDIGDSTRIADFGCGPGLYAIRLARLGANVTGIDFSATSTQYAKAAAEREQLDIAYVNQDYLDFNSEDRFDLVVMIMCDFCALSPKQRKRLLGNFRRILKPGGSVLMDVYSYQAFEQKEEGASYEVNQLNGFWSPDKYYGFVNTFKYADEKLLLDKYTIVEAARTREVYNWLQCFTPESLERELSAAGLAVDALYSDVAGTPYDETASEFAVVARNVEMESE